MRFSDQLDAASDRTLTMHEMTDNRKSGWLKVECSQHSASVSSISSMLSLSISELYLIHAEHFFMKPAARWRASPATQSRKVGGWLLTPAVTLMIGHAIAIHTSTVSSHNAQVVRVSSHNAQVVRPMEAGKDAGRGVEIN